MEQNYAQIINGAIDAKWVMTILFGVVGYLLNRNLTKIEKILDRQETRLDIVEKDIIVMKAKDDKKGYAGSTEKWGI